MFVKFFSIISLLFLPLCAGQFEKKVSVIYDSLNPTSLTELLAFYHLYPQTLQGKRAFDQAWELINAHRDIPISPLTDIELPDIDIDLFIAMVTKQAGDQVPIITDRMLSMMEHITNHLHHKKIKGHKVWTIKEVHALPVEDIDLARALLIHQFGDDNRKEIRSYESYLDLMALQILSKLPKNPTHLELVDAISQFIFLEMKFRFPPHSMWAKDVDHYTFLPAVLDSRHGVCLGVSILYLSLAQRLNLPLEIVTPPGHIYICYKQKDGTNLNIETTARGIDMPDERYLSINTCALQKRNIKEVIGMNFVNAAATEWHKKNYDMALKLYSEASPYLPNDRLINIFMGFNYLFIGQEEEGKRLLTLADANPSTEEVYSDTTIKDFLQGYIDGDGIKTIYQEVDESRDSILKKQQELINLVEKWPKFREGIFHVAVTFLQLGRSKEALEWLTKYHDLDNNNPTVEYYLGILCLNRFAYKKGLSHINRCSEIVALKNHSPRALDDLKNEFRKVAPYYINR